MGFMRHAFRARRGFTLAELLAVVTVIMVLIALFLPALQKVEGKVSTFRCQARLRDLGSAFFLFAGDNDGYMPSFTWCYYDSAGYLDVRLPGAHNICYYLGVWDVRALAHCPDVPAMYQRDWNAIAGGITVEGAVNFVYNSAWFGRWTSPQFGQYGALIRLSSARTPSFKNVLMDGTSTYGSGEIYYAAYVDRTFGDFLLPRHGGGQPSGYYMGYGPTATGTAANVFFADGHVQLLTYGKAPLATEADLIRLNNLSK